MSEILVTGGMGFIGSRLAHDLVLKNHKVIIVDNMSYGNFDNAVFDDMNILDKCKFYKYDVSNKEQMTEVFDNHNFEFVYHIAGIAPLPDCQLRKNDCLKSNVEGTLNVLDQSALKGIKRFMFSSTNAVYENVSKYDFPIKECINVETSLMYPTSKLMAENLCKSFSRTYHLPMTIFRFSNVYGGGMDILRKFPPVTGAFIKNLYNNVSPIIYGNGMQIRDFIYIEDLIELIEKPINFAKNDFEIMNVASGESHSISEQFAIIRNIMAKKDIAPNYEKPEKFWAKMEDLYIGKYQIDKNVLEREAKKCTCIDISYANEQYSWEPKYSFKEGLKKTINEMVNLLDEKRQIN